MSVWRRKAADLFPELKRDLNDKEFTIYMLFTDLGAWTREAHEADDNDRLRSIYGFAEWCLSQKAKDLWNAAGVSFYEHLVDVPRLWPKVVPWLSRKVIEQVRSLWEFRLGPAEYAKFDRLIRQRKSLGSR